MQLVSLAQVGDRWWIVTIEENEQSWDVTQFKPGKAKKSKTLERALQSAKARSLPFVEINFSQEQMHKIESLVQEAINRKQQRRLGKERLKPEQRQHQKIQEVIAEQTPQPQQPAPLTPQALLEEIQHLEQQLAETERKRDELDKQVSRLQEEVKNLRAQLKQ